MLAAWPFTVILWTWASEDWAHISFSYSTNILSPAGWMDSTRPSTPTSPLWRWHVARRSVSGSTHSEQWGGGGLWGGNTEEASPNSMFSENLWSWSWVWGMDNITGILSRTQLWDSISTASDKSWPASGREGHSIKGRIRKMGSQKWAGSWAPVEAAVPQADGWASV